MSNLEDIISMCMYMYQKKKTLVIKNVEKLNIRYNVGESVKWYNHSGNHYGDVSEIKTWHSWVRWHIKSCLHVTW